MANPILPFYFQSSRIRFHSLIGFPQNFFIFSFHFSQSYSVLLPFIASFPLLSSLSECSNIARVSYLKRRKIKNTELPLYDLHPAEILNTKFLKIVPLVQAWCYTYHYTAIKSLIAFRLNDSSVHQMVFIERQR